MSRILLAWELGEGYGHARRLLPLAMALRARGHEVVVAAKEHGSAETIFRDQEIAVLQAPVWPVQSEADQVPALNYAELLSLIGYRDAEGLAAMAKRWRGLFHDSRPDLIVADHAPTALLAARTLGLKRAAIGTGFACPPHQSPMPTMQPWKAVSLKRLGESEDKVMSVVGRVLADLRAEPLAHLSDLFATDETFLCTFPELDHYERRGDASYWGPVFSAPAARPVEWPDGDGPRVLVYLPVTYPGLGYFFDQLRALGYPSLAHVRGATDELRRALDCETIRVAAEPINLPQALTECSAVVCHGAHGTVAAGLLAGRPQLLLPQYLEQMLLAYRVKKSGATLTFNPGRRQEDYGRLLKRLLADPSYANKARSFAASHAGLDHQATSIAQRCEDIVGGH